MTGDELEAAIDAVVAKANRGRATAAKRGRNPKFPWVPIIDYGPQREGVHVQRTSQVRGRAYRSREEAVAVAQAQIDRASEVMAAQLRQPTMRAMRSWHGLPRELPAKGAGRVL